jgi:hypothetical protein
LRPDGTAAASQIGFSQHAPADKTPKVDFCYTGNTADDVLPGDWVLSITNDSDVRVVDFDIDRDIDPNPVMPNFTSTFTAVAADCLSGAHRASRTVERERSRAP